MQVEGQEGFVRKHEVAEASDPQMFQSSVAKRRLDGEGVCSPQQTIFMIKVQSTSNLRILATNCFCHPCFDLLNPLGFIHISNLRTLSKSFWVQTKTHANSGNKTTKNDSLCGSNLKRFRTATKHKVKDRLLQTYLAAEMTSLLLRTSGFSALTR